MMLAMAMARQMMGYSPKKYDRTGSLVHHRDEGILVDDEEEVMEEHAQEALYRQKDYPHDCEDGALDEEDGYDACYP